MNRIKALLSTHVGWIILGLQVVFVITFVAVMLTKAGPTTRTIAQPLSENEITFNMERNHAYSAGDGVIVIGEMGTPAAIATAAVKVGGRYTLPDDALMIDGSIGVLSVPKLSLSVNVYETDDEMEAMTHGLAHFKTTSSWSGNIGLAGHNVNEDLTDGFLKNLHTLKPGDAVLYRTALGARTYAVTTIREIDETDWSYLGRTEDDRVTIITCISGKPRSRLVVQAAAS